jgi:hypothetical protein
MYRTFRDPSDPRHVVLSTNRVTRTTKQIHTYLLCDVCEERFNSYGERWVLQNCLKPTGEFTLRDALRAAKPIFKTPTGGGYPGDTPGVQMNQLVYFAASLFWRAAIYDWSQVNELGEKLNLGPYEEQLRTFLLGLNEFPKNACMIVYVADSADAVASFPAGGRVEDNNYHQYQCHIPGAMFFFLLGQLIPTDFQNQLCAVRSPRRIVFLTTQVREFWKKAALDLRSKLPASELSK